MNDEYFQRLGYCKETLAPFLRAKYSNWDAQAVIDLLTHLFSMAKEHGWVTPASRAVGGVPFFEYYDGQIGQRVWRATVSLSAGRWTENRFAALDFRGWQKPVIPKPLSSDLLPRQVLAPSGPSIKIKTRQGQQSPLQSAEAITKQERLSNRKIWNALFRDIILLNRKPDAEIYEETYYATYIFRFERIFFRDHVWRAVIHGIDHSSLCEYILRPLFFSAMYNVREMVPRRVVSRQFIKAAKGNGRLEILPLMDLCCYCGSPLKRSIGGRKVRNDSKFCPGNTCKNAYHQGKKMKRN